MKLELKYAPIYDEKTDTTIYRVPLGSPTGEFVVPNSEDPGYSVYLDENLTDEEAIEKAEHAIEEHEKKNHHGMGADVQRLEAEAHGIKPPRVKKPKTRKNPPIKEKNYRRLLRPEEYEKLGIDPKYAEILKLTVIEKPKISKREYAQFCDEMKYINKRR